MSANLPTKGTRCPYRIAFIGHPYCAGGYFFGHEWLFGQQASLLFGASRPVKPAFLRFAHHVQTISNKFSRLQSRGRLFNYPNPKEMLK